MPISSPSIFTSYNIFCLTKSDVISVVEPPIANAKVRYFDGKPVSMSAPTAASGISTFISCTWLLVLTIVLMYSSTDEHFSSFADTSLINNPTNREYPPSS